MIILFLDFANKRCTPQILDKVFMSAVLLLSTFWVVAQDWRRRGAAERALRYLITLIFHKRLLILVTDPTNIVTAKSNIDTLCLADAGQGVYVGSVAAVDLLGSRA